MADYLDLLAQGRSGPEFAASAKRKVTKRRKSRPKPLTRRTNQRKLTSGVAKAHQGRKRGQHTKTSRKATMAKRKKARRSKKGGRLTKAEIKKAGSLKAAWRARKAGGGKKRRSKGKRRAKRRSRKSAAVAVTYTPKRRRRGKRKSRKSGSGKRKSAKRVAAGRKAARTRKARKSARRTAARKSSRRGKRRGKRRSRKSGSKRRSRRSSKRSRKSPVKVTISRRGRRVASVAAEPRRRRRRTHRRMRKARKSAHRRHRRSAAMENPMTGVELFVGSVTGLLGFLTADVLDRFLATHALVASTTTATAGAAQTYTDTPPTSGDYQGLYNATAICAPMNATRWLAGLGVAGVPLVIAHFVSAPTGRAALQFFGFAAGVRIVGKGLIDMVAQLVQSNPIGQQLYDGEMRAAVLAANQGNASAAALSTLPTAGLGRGPRQLGAGKPGCAPCATKALGTGYPSAPRQATMGASTAPSAPIPATTPTTQNQPPAATATPAAATPPPAPAPTASNNSGLTGTRRGVGASAKRGRFNWGSDE